MNLPDVHIGRSFTGHRIEDSCPCEQELCGLVSRANVNPECDQHHIDFAQTMRQAHDADKCPALLADCNRRNRPEGE